MTFGICGICSFTDGGVFRFKCRCILKVLKFLLRSLHLEALIFSMTLNPNISMNVQDRVTGNSANVVKVIELKSIILD